MEQSMRIWGQRVETVGALGLGRRVWGPPQVGGLGQQVEGSCSHLQGKE